METLTILQNCRIWLQFPLMWLCYSDRLAKFCAINSLLIFFRECFSFISCRNFFVGIYSVTFSFYVMHIMFHLFFFVVFLSIAVGCTGATTMLLFDQHFPISGTYFSLLIWIPLLLLFPFLRSATEYAHGDAYWMDHTFIFLHRVIHDVILLCCYAIHFLMNFAVDGLVVWHYGYIKWKYYQSSFKVLDTCHISIFFLLI